MCFAQIESVGSNCGSELPKRSIFEFLCFTLLFPFKHQFESKYRFDPDYDTSIRKLRSKFRPKTSRQRKIEFVSRFVSRLVSSDVSTSKRRFFAFRFSYFSVSPFHLSILCGMVREKSITFPSDSFILPKVWFCIMLSAYRLHRKRSIVLVVCI